MSKPINSLTDTNAKRTLHQQILDTFESHWKVQRLPAKSALVSPGEHPGTVIFVDKGLLRVCVQRYDGKSFNKTFVAEGMFYADLYDYWLNQPSSYLVEALEPCQVRTIPIALFDETVDKDDNLARLFMEYLKSRYMRHEQREIMLQTMSAKERYVEFLKHLKPLESRLPAYHIASYLGMTEVNLSRVKKDLAKNGE